MMRVRLGCAGGAAALLAFVLALPVAAQTHAGAAQACGELANAFGPFDYRPSHYKAVPGDQYSHAFKLNLVEIAHFTPKVQALLAGQSTVLPGPDLDYTLRAFPNHHRALVSLLRLLERSNVPNPAGLPRSIDCYFDRAVRFAPDDVVVRLLYASLLFKAKQVENGRAQIKLSQRLAGDNPFTNYNIGLVCAEAGEYEVALLQAHKAMALGFMRMELKDKLVAAGRWSEPAAASARDTDAHQPPSPASAPP